MDGVLVDFERSMSELCNSALSDEPLPFSKGKAFFWALAQVKNKFGPHWRLTSFNDLKIPEVSKLSFTMIMSEPGVVFANMYAFDDGLNQLWPYINSLGYPVNILSAPVHGFKTAKSTASEGKHAWIAEKLNPLPEQIFIASAKQKPNWAIEDGERNLLIDDKLSTVEAWIQRGGLGILHEAGNSLKTINVIHDVFFKS